MSIQFRERGGGVRRAAGLQIGGAHQIERLPSFADRCFDESPRRSPDSFGLRSRRSQLVESGRGVGPAVFEQ